MIEYLEEIIEDLKQNDINYKKQKIFALENAIEILEKLRNEG